jgi:nickel transport protein
MRALAALFLALILAGPAAAHGLKVFASVDGARVTGYAFFIGGGRPKGAGWRAEMGGAQIAQGRTDNEGAFEFVLPGEVTAALNVTVSLGDGHAATKSLAPERFGAMAVAASDPPAPTPDAAPSPDAVARAVEAAVARQIAPLHERIEELDARLRLADVLSGIFLILGLAGIGLWALGRRR